MFRSFIAVSITAALLLGSVGAYADEPQIHWPAGWQIEEVVRDADASIVPARVLRQRAIKNDENGTTLMVMELTRTSIEPGHKGNMQRVLLEMRKAAQVDFMKTGYQSVCRKPRPTTLSRFEALETSCVITQNGNPLLSQAWVLALGEDKAYVFSYAGKTQAYAASMDEVLSVRNSLKL